MARLAAAILVLASTVWAADAPHWVATWAAGPSAQNADAGAMRVRKLEFTDQTVREIVHASIGGEMVRVTLSNVFGTLPIHVAAAHMGRSAEAGTVVPGSDRVLMFDGKPAVTIPPGAQVMSDAVALKIPVLSDLEISLYFRETTMTSTLHYAAQQSSYVNAGDVTGAEKLPDPAPITSWPFLTEVDVTAPPATGLIVAFGDSITDGAKSQMNANHRWPNILANRLITPKGPNRWAVVDEGIGGNRILRDAAGRNVAYGVSGLPRFDRDVLGLAGVSYVVILEGINDLGSPETTAEEIIAALQQMAERAHAKGVRVIGGTITPAERAGAGAKGPSDREKRRSAVNEWIRTTKTLDGFVDFDKALEDPAQPGTMLAAYDSGDHLHPNDAGYQKMGEAVDLKLFRPVP